MATKFLDLDGLKYCERTPAYRGGRLLAESG